MLTATRVFGRARRFVLTLAALVAVATLLSPADTFAQSRHRARLSGDLADRLAKRIEASTTVIVSAADANIDQLAARYGARLEKRIVGGAVFEATGGQIDAL